MRPIVNFFALQICGKKGENALNIKDNLVTFHAIETHPVKGIYPRRTFNAWDSVAERVKKMHLKPGSEVSIVAEMEHYIGSDGLPRDSFNVLKIDFLKNNGGGKTSDTNAAPTTSSEQEVKEEEKANVPAPTPETKPEAPKPQEPEVPTCRGQIGIGELENLFN